MDNFPLKIDITVANLQYIINVLGARPYSEVALILPALKQQAEMQIAAANAPPPSAEKPAKVKPVPANAANGTARQLLAD